MSLSNVPHSYQFRFYYLYILFHSLNYLCKKIIFKQFPVCIFEAEAVLFRLRIYITLKIIFLWFSSYIKCDITMIEKSFSLLYFPISQVFKKLFWKKVLLLSLHEIHLKLIWTLAFDLSYRTCNWLANINFISFWVLISFGLLWFNFY